MDNSARTKAELTKAEDDIDMIYSKLDSVLIHWRDGQLQHIAAYKDKITNWEVEILEKDAKLRSLRDQDIDIGTLITKLTEKNTDLSPNLDHKPRQARYSLSESCESLQNSMADTIRSQYFVTNKRRKQHPSPCVGSKRKRQQQISEAASSARSEIQL